MANIQSAKKNIRKTLKHTLHNRSVKSTLRTLEKRVKQVAEAKKSSSDIKEAVSRYISALDKAAKRNIIHSNKARRHKSACAKLLAG